MKDVNDIVKEYLKENEFDGLYNPDGECACEINDLQPCCENFSECRPGYIKTCDQLTDEEKKHLDGACDWFICKDKHD